MEGTCMTNPESLLPVATEKLTFDMVGEQTLIDLDIVRVTTANIAVLALVDDDIFDGDLEPGRITRFVSDAGHLLIVAIRDSVVIGQVQATVQLHLDNTPQLYIDNLGVSPKHQRQRIASALLKAIVYAGAELGCEQAWIITETDNHQANALYESIGAEHSTAALYSFAIRTEGGNETLPESRSLEEL